MVFDISISMGECVGRLEAHITHVGCCWGDRGEKTKVVCVCVCTVVFYVRDPRCVSVSFLNVCLCR